MVGDLKGIDDLLDYVQDGLDAAYGGDSPMQMAQVTLGVKYPLTVTVYSNDSGTGHAHQEMTQHHAALNRQVGLAWGRSEAEAFRSSTQDIVRPVSGEFADAAYAVHDQIVSTLNSVVTDDFAKLQSTEASWDGEAAHQFFDYVYNSMGGARDNQALCAEGVAYGIAASKAVVDLGQQSVMSLVTAAWKVVDKQLQERKASHTSRPMTAADWLQLTTTLVGVAAAIPTGGTSLAATEVASRVATSSLALLSYAADHQAGPTVSFSASSADDVSAQLASGLSDTRKQLEQLWADANSHVDDVMAHVSQAEAAQLLWPREPRLPQHTTPGQFEHTSNA